MSDSGTVSVLGICGSLRKASYNMAALRAAIAQKPAGMSVTVADISQIPPYNEDVRAAGLSAAGRDLAEARSPRPTRCSSPAPNTIIRCRGS